MTPQERAMAFLCLVCFSLVVFILIVQVGCVEKRTATLETQMQVKSQAVHIEQMKVEVVTPVQYRSGLPGFGGKDGKQ